MLPMQFALNNLQFHGLVQEGQKNKIIKISKLCLHFIVTKFTIRPNQNSQSLNYVGHNYLD